MRLYEIDIKSLWWLAASDEMEAIDILRDELFNREISEEEMDTIIDDLDVKELEQADAEMISMLDEYGPAIQSLWELFCQANEPGLLSSDFHKEDEDYEDFEPYDGEGSLPGDWY